MRGAVLILGLLLATPVGAEAPTASLRPLARPQADVPAAPVVMAPSAALTFPRPVLRRAVPGRVSLAPQAAPVAAFRVATSPFAPRMTDRPYLRPAALTQRVTEQAAAVVRGQVCGDPAIQGEVIADIAGPGGCGVLGAVRVKSVAGVSLSTEPTIDCNTAKALRRWVSDGIIPAVGNTGGGVAALQVVGHYTCRSRVGGSATNNKLSEHGRGRAVDIGGIQLKDGRALTVLTDWGSGTAGQQLKAMWKAACGPFGTVLGPAANAAHRDHFHVDTARYRSGTYCR
ncbi:extensin family protein [Loktanella sp. DJP18]|uniref:extensin-like domain-containing protein n=1 Tax=Loktanella sp. DJP18 TaxID=3409788 RepID=UPI003BB4FFC4